jgi:hypothetical protein
MTIDLSTYDRGYYGYLNDSVREALGALQDNGAIRAVVQTAAQLSSVANPETRNVAVVIDEQQLYAWNESAGSWLAIGASQTVLQQLIDGSFDGGVTTLLSSNLAIAGGQTAGVPDPLGNTSGWYFKNSADLTDKINWYYAANSNPAVNMTLGNFTAQYAVVEVRASGSPYFVIYTKPTGTNDAGGWYKSRIVYAPASPYMDLTAYVGQTVFLHWGVDTGDFPTLPRVECTLDSFSSNGLQDAGEEILFANISTSTGYAAGHYEFVVSDLGYELNNSDVQFTLSAPATTGGAPATLDDAFIRLDGVNDFVSLTGTGSVLDYTATWTIGLEITELPANTTDNTFWCFARSGNNGLSLRKGGSNWGFYAAQNQYSVAQANTWRAPSAGSRILVECDGTKLSYWLDGTRRSHTTMNATYRDGTDHVVNSLEIGKGGIPFAQGTFQYAEGGFDNLIVTYNILSASEKAEFFAGGDVTQHSYYAAARDAVPFGEGTFPNVTGEKANITGSLVNGTSDDFVERT